MKKTDLNNLIFAHRGVNNNKNIPENSTLAFILALNKGIPIELDVQTTKDNKLIVFHDTNLKRMTGINERVNKTNYEEIKSYKLLNTNYSIPTLEEILSLVSGKVLLNIEIKNINKASLINLEKLLNKYSGEFILSSFSPNIIKYFKKRKYLIGLLLGVNFFNNRINILGYNPDFLAISKNFIRLKKVQNRRNKNLPFFVWTIEKSEISKYKEYANSFICNIKTGV